jgi:AcrR family transcriptional regulator
VNRPVPLESQRERRRAHLVSVAAHIVATFGVDAVSHALVAELAACTRTLVYNYFSRREDLLYAVIEAFDDGRDRLDLRQSAPLLIGPDADEASGRERFESLWQPQDWQPDALELRLAVLTLIRDVHLGAALGEHQADLERWIDDRLHEPLRQIGLAPIEVKIFVDAILSVQYHVTAAALNGDISREAGVDLMFGVIQSTLRIFLR